MRLGVPVLLAVVDRAAVKADDTTRRREQLQSKRRAAAATAASGWLCRPGDGLVVEAMAATIAVATVGGATDDLARRYMLCGEAGNVIVDQHRKGRV